MKLELAGCLLALAACGSDSKSLAIDAPDSAADAPNPGPDAPAMGPVTIRLVDGSNSHVGAAVSFAGPDGHVVKETTLDQNGAATATVVAGSSVTAVYADDTLVTYLDVHPGDNLVFDTTGGTAPTPEGTVTVTSSTYATTNPTYTIMTGNGMDATTTSASLQLTDQQLGGGKYNLVGMVTADMNNVTTPIAYATKLGLVPPANGGPTTVAMPAWKTDFDSITVALTNGASDAASATFQVAPFLDTQYFTLPTRLDATFSNRTAGGAIKVPKDAFTSYQIRTQIMNTTNTSGVITFTPLAAVGLAQLDASTMLPFIHGVQVTLPSGATEPHVAFTADGPLTQAFGAVDILKYNNAAGAMNHYIVTTHVATEIALPDLGVAQAAFAPATPFVQSPSDVIVVTGGIFTDRKDFRENWFRMLMSLQTFQPGLTQPYSITVAQ